MDDLLDLSWGSGAPASKQNGSAPAPRQPAQHVSRTASPAYSAFDSLASPGQGSVPNYTNAYSASYGRSVRANSPSGQLGSAASTGTGGSARTPSPNPAGTTAQSSASRDAFSSLFDGPSASSSTQSARQNSMTLQERMQAQASTMGLSVEPSQLRQHALTPLRSRYRYYSSSNNSRTPVNANVPQKASSDPWDFDMLSISTPSTSQNSVVTTQSPPAPLLRQSSPFDVFDQLNESKASSDYHSEANVTVQPRHVTSHAAHDDSDDILGVLGQPVSDSRPRAPEVVAPRPTKPSKGRVAESPGNTSRPPSRAVAARTPSPPPHILGKIVSMGFSVQQARLALAATLGSENPGEWNLPGALDILASDSAASAARSREIGQKPSRRQGSYSDDDDYTRRPRRQTATSPRQDRNGGEGRMAQAINEPPKAPAETTANELLQQASVFGSSVLKSANAYWKTSRAQLQKAIEENRLAVPSASGSRSGRTSPALSGKPRWMTETAGNDDHDADQLPSASSFKDDDAPIEGHGGSFTDPVLPAHPSEQRANGRARSLQSERPTHANGNGRTALDNQSLRVSGVPPEPKSASLLPSQTSEKRMYASPNRRKPPASAPVTPRAPAPLATPAPKPKRPRRQPVVADPRQLSQSQQHRSIGNEHFKLGRYGEAVEAYNLALDALPEGHLSRIAVLNNRANARLKIGEERKASEDASAVLMTLAGSSNSSQASAMKKEDCQAIFGEFEGYEPGQGEGEKVDSRDALGKALSRRARGFEGCEKWRLAMLDWQVLTELGDPVVVKSAGGLKMVAEGLARCRRVVEGPSAGAANRQTAGTAKPKPPVSRPKPPTRAQPAKSSVAVNELRHTTAQTDADEAERIRVKDEVDARILAWRGGKETNLRALIASLDNVLWDELGWKSVGMHELISDGQLKVRYIRAISKVHPDKLGPGLSVERRLIANGVFSTLSDAWNAHINK